MFLSPQYKVLPPPALSTYLQLSISLLSNFPTNFVLGSPRTQGASTKMTKPTATWNKDDSDSDSDDGPSTRVTVVDKFTTTPFQPPPPKIDDKTIKRLQNLKSAPHLTSIISTTRSNSALFPHLVHYLFTIMTTWPSSRDQILNIVLAAAGGGLFRELYRELVRQSPLGKEEKSDRLLGILTAFFIFVFHSLIPMFQMHQTPHTGLQYSSCVICIHRLY
jgi:ubiquitin-protein ligase E3 C